VDERPRDRTALSRWLAGRQDRCARPGSHPPSSRWHYPAGPATARRAGGCVRPTRSPATCSPVLLW